MRLASWATGLVLLLGLFLLAGIGIRTSVARAFDNEQLVRSARSMLSTVVKGQLDEETGIRGYAVTHDAGFLQPYEQARNALPAVFPRLQTALDRLALPDAAADARKAKAINAAWVAGVAIPLLSRPLDARGLEAGGKRRIDRFRQSTNLIDAALDARNAQLRGRFEADLTALGVLVAVTALLLFGGSVLFIVNQRREQDMHAAYQAEKRIADTLQQAFSQRGLPALPSISFSGTYVPATEESLVGGDWYDAFEIGEGRILFCIGDIAGHGLEAAVAMNYARGEVLSAALVDADPARILARVNERILETTNGVSMVTAIVGVADSRTYTFTYSAAGHPPPALLEVGRAPQLLECGGMPLGITLKAQYVNACVQTLPGALLVLYTDGVVEHSRNVIDGERELLEAIAALPPSGHPAAAIYQAIFERHRVNDDVAILTVGFAAKTGTSQNQALGAPSMEAARKNGQAPEAPEAAGVESLRRAS